MSDGAHQGVSARRALDTILGGAEQPAEDEQRNPDEMRRWLLAAPGPPFEDDGDGYEACARWAARRVLEAFLADPQLASTPIETVFDWPTIRGESERTGRDPSQLMGEHTVAVGLYDVLKARGVDLGELGLSGFQWGWAANAARYCVELGPQPNPAIIEMDV